ncbi:MAG TPA: hypothetical protein VMF52_13155 [Steroidobacteraceae bacterium]|nr:hypothetical protein [Steroidobacteraceae bacterium]
MRFLERSLFFALGAAVGAVLLLLPGRSAAVGGPAAPTTDSREIAQRLDQIDRRLAAMEARGASPAAREDSGTEVVAATPVGPPTSAELRAAQASSVVIDRAIAAGTWSRHDTDEFRVAAADMRGDERIELLRRLTVAINEDRLKVESGVSLP